MLMLMQVFFQTFCVGVPTSPTKKHLNFDMTGQGQTDKWLQKKVNLNLKDALVRYKA